MQEKLTFYTCVCEGSLKSDFHISLKLDFIAYLGGSENRP